jgi:hypothetical protein
MIEVRKLASDYKTPQGISLSVDHAIFENNRIIIADTKANCESFLDEVKRKEKGNV